MACQENLEDERVLIEAREVHKHFGSVVAVDGASFTVGAGEIVGFVGPNGAGKSTVLRILAAYLWPDQGAVRVGGMSTATHSLEVRRLIGYLPGDTPLYSGMQVRKFLEFVARARGLRGDAGRPAMDVAIQRAGIESVLERRVGDCSTGFRQRVGLAAALVHDPPVLLLDEPTHGFDPLQVMAFRRLLDELRPGRATLFSTHIIQDVEAVCDRVLLIDQGRLLGAGAPAELAASVGLPGAGLEATFARLVETRGELLDANRAPSATASNIEPARTEGPAAKPPAPTALSAVATIFKRELGALFDSAIAYTVAAAVLATAAAVFMNGFFLRGVLDMRPYFDTLAYVLVGWAPALTMRAWAEERAAGTLELLLTLPLRPWQVVAGKYLACLSFFALTLAGAAPIAFMLHRFGLGDWGPVVGGVAGTLGLGSVLIAMGLWISSLTRDQVVAFVGSALGAFFVLAIGLPRVVEILDGLTAGTLGSALNTTIAALPHHHAAADGLITGAAVIYWLGLTLVFLWLNERRVAERA